jgi:DNA-binding beta-propeller fold protein YncE
VLVSNFFNNQAYVLSTVSDEIEHTIENLDGPEDIVMSHDGQYIYAVNFNNPADLF